MTKRSNPFTEDFVQQSKVHVGMKQFNNNEDRLQKVYEKTLELLFRGAKMPTKSVSEITTVNEIRKDGFKQLFLGKDGHLQQSGAVSLSPRSVHAGLCQRTNARIARKHSAEPASIPASAVNTATATTAVLQDLKARRYVYPAIVNLFTVCFTLYLLSS
ncbi:apoptosis regulatory protein Siva-like isoform X1 [Cydia pomonella]|uniref:apoptosis regulatory protein Siva-like isoform X1 n=1 Tax=Cydia pomonella TaxID=82600 RepID=UPI002ADE5AE6|nr:apoptosis regulatory protein Siva-like isoform X1 [Cydia pomonella]